MPKKLLALLATAGILGAVANAVSPRGIAWKDPLGSGLKARAALSGLVPVDLEAVRTLLKDPRMVVLDSRPKDEFALGRLPGARSLPWSEVEDGRGAMPPPGRPILVYCANEFCESSLRLGEWLRARGVRDVALFVDGYEAWWNAKSPVDQD
jgi:ArsR family transcriptional regulator